MGGSPKRRFVVAGDLAGARLKSLTAPSPLSSSCLKVALSATRGDLSGNCQQVRKCPNANTEEFKPVPQCDRKRFFVKKMNKDAARR